jgi:prophage antirepressor-like protein
MRKIRTAPSCVRTGRRLWIFKIWVCDEVLPSIREHGMYATGETLERIITSPEFGIRLLSELKDEREARMRESALRNQTV